MRNVDRTIKYLILVIIIVVFIIFQRTCGTNESSKGSSKGIEEEKTQAEQVEETDQERLNSSDIYLIGQWELHYTDIVNYEYDDLGMPDFDLYKQPSSYTIDMENKGLIVNEIYPVIESKHEDKHFTLKVDLKIVELQIEGQIEDENNWKGTLEYIGEGEQLVSKCSVVAKRK